MNSDDTNKFFRWKCYKGLRKLGLDKKKDYIDRLEYELRVIENMRFQDYFLVVCDFIAWARANSILVGPGRGSVAGSLAAYCLNITQIDPIRYDLIFERFLNPSRIACPDIDVDIQEDKRGEVVDYVRRKYGEKRVAGISTYGSLKCRGAIKAVARTLGAEYSIGDTLSKLTPPPINGVPPKLEKCYEEVPKLRAYRSNKDSIEGKILYWAEQIEDRIDHTGGHASGICISDTDLTDTVPLIEDRKGQLLTQWDMNEIEKAGLVKFDFLGLTTLTVISTALKLIEDRTSKRIDIQTIPLDDKKVFFNLQNGDTAGIFQAETSSGMRELIVKMSPKNIEDLGILGAVFRPGPLSSHGMEKWLDVRAGKEDVEYLVPELEPILGSTGGFLIYQEQCMNMAVTMAGYTLPEADQLRKVIGKKLPEEMKKEEARFKGGLLKKGFSQKVADKLFSEIETFAGYGFNKAHAIAYGYLMYQTAWLKANFPVEYMCAALTCNQDDIDQVIKYIFNCRDLGIKVLPPDINTSNTAFTIDKDNNIRFGLAAIKNLGEDIVDSIILTRGNNKFHDILDFISRVDIGKVNKRKLDSLVLAGAFDHTGNTRASMLNVIEQAIEHKKLTKSYESKNETYQKKLEAYNARNEELRLTSIAGLKTKLKPLKNPERPILPKRPSIRMLSELPEKEILTNEKELLGYYISGHPIEKYKRLIQLDEELRTIEEIKTTGENGNTIELISIPNSVTERTSKKSGKKMASLILEDCTGSIGATAFAKTWDEYRIYLESGEPLRLKCKVNLQEANDAITTAELIILQVQILHNITTTEETINVTIPLKLKTVGELSKLLNKFNGTESKIRLQFSGEYGTIVSSSQVYNIKNRDQFLKEIIRLSE